MKLSDRQWQILVLLALVCLLTGAMLWLGQSPWAAIIGGAQEATQHRPGRQRPAPPGPGPAGPGRESGGSLRGVAAALVPRDAPPEEVRAVAAVFRGVAGDYFGPQAARQLRRRDRDAVPSARAVLKLTAGGLARVLGGRAPSWEPFGSGMAEELRRLELHAPEDFVVPWNQIADGLEQSRPED